MKKARLVTLFALIITVALFVLMGCQKEDKALTVALKDHDPEAVIEIEAGALDYSSYTLVVTYQSGKTEEVALAEEMIAQTDLVKLYREGEHEISVSYGGCKGTFKVSVKKSTFKDLSFPENNVFTYDGKPHTVELEGNIPANAVITYTGGNSFVNAGTYDVTAVVFCEGYVTARLSTTVKIERAKYDMSGVKFEAKEYVYDGQTHSVSISGTLPEGVSSPTYTINEKQTSGAINAGEYQVIARFSNKDPNYEPIPDMETTLRILPAVYTVKGVDIVFSTEDGEVIDGTTKIYNGKSITFDLNDYSKLSKRVSVSFSVSDQNGNEISTSNEITNIRDVGVYTVKVEFTLTDGKNYQPIEPLVSSFEVLRAEYPAIDDVRLVSMQTTYDAKPHSIEIEGKLPEGVTVYYEYYLGSTLITDPSGKPAQSVTDTGIYTVKAIFSHNKENLGKIPELSATLNIKKSEVSLSALGFKGESSVEYSGSSYEPTFTTWQESFMLNYDIFQYSAVKYYVLNSSGAYVELGENVYPTDVGSYRASVEISIADAYKENYVMPGTAAVQTLVKQFDIVRKQLDIPAVTFTGAVTEWDYTGVAQSIPYQCDADASLMTVSTLYYKYSAGEYIAMKAGEIPTDAGSYNFVVAVAVKDATRYVFTNEEESNEASFEFAIKPQGIAVSGIAASYETVSYSGANQVPSLVSVPAHVNTSVKLYTSDGTSPINQALNVGKYRIEVTLAAESANYTLSSSAKLVFRFEIVPQRIHVGDLSFDSTTFVYNGSGQQPTLKDLPAHVSTGFSVTANDGVGNFIPIAESVDAGKYEIKIRLLAEGPNYVLFDGTQEITEKEYTTQYEIKAQVIDLDAVRVGGIELAFTDGGYNASALESALDQKLFGELRNHVEWNVLEIHSDPEGANTKVDVADTAGEYSLTCRIATNSFGDGYGITRNNYTLLYNGRKYYELNGKTITFHIVNQ